jgi:hypothetical protein
VHRGSDLPATAVKEGAFEQEDLTLLWLTSRNFQSAADALHAGVSEISVGREPVIVAVPEGTARSHIMSPQLLPFQYRTRFSTVISDVATTGNSGSGVFDAGSKCLLGIMSRKIQVLPSDAEAGREPTDLAKYFVPASTIAAFIPTEYRF